MEIAHISVIIPAAGHSTRFGKASKLDQAWACGRSMLESVAYEAGQVGAREVLVVVRAPRPGLNCVVVDGTEGMAGSVAAGVRAAHPLADGFLIWPADMPLIQTSHVQTLLSGASASGGRAVRPQVGNTPGHPVFFPAHFRPQLEQLDPGESPGQLLNQENCRTIEFSEQAVIQDIDTPEAYRRLRPDA